MFWNDPEGAEAIIQVRAAALSDDERLAQHLRTRPAVPLHDDADPADPQLRNQKLTCTLLDAVVVFRGFHARLASNTAAADQTSSDAGSGTVVKVNPLKVTSDPSAASPLGSRVK